MKTITIILVFWSPVCFAQTTSEWMQQKKTQKKYLLQQIAALKVYGNYLAKGYAITHDGLKTIGGLKQECYNDDSKHFESLEIISARVRQYQRVRDMIAIHLSIIKTIGETSH